MVAEFGRFSMSGVRILTGVIQVVAAAGLVIGFWVPKIGALAATGLALQMLAGIGVRMRIARQVGFQRIRPPAVSPDTRECPPRQITEAQLARAANISAAIDCECTQHLAGLITSLVGFEQYCAECESRNTADAGMRLNLHKMTAHTRNIGGLSRGAGRL
ncbi:MAG: DoxX family protein [Verrucomicrobiales bacterium]